MEDRKRALIIRYVLPAFESAIINKEHLLESIMKVCRLHHATKYQELEVPGPFQEGRLWFSITAMVHGYYYCPHKLVKKGTRIWKKREFLLFSSSLFEKGDRSDCLEIIESGEVLSVTYQNLTDLIYEYPQIEKYIRHTLINNERHYHQRNLLLNKPPLERVRKFINENKLFIRCSSQEVQAMHVNLSLRAYINQLQKLKRSSSP